ncbi:MAG TPA: aldo/keto reductase [Micropepsaceae bacterium]|nr:aldo/keto reductase [Micropepsaceae bacterium]
MMKRQLGRSGLEIAPIVFGGNVLGWTVDQANAFRILDAFIDAGFNAIDTADTYSRWVPGHKGGESETIIGKWLAQGGGRRERVLILTKLGAEMGPDKKGLSRRYMKAEIEDSLRRLKIDTIDLYQSHRDDPSTPMLETLETYAELIKEGKVRAIGASNFTAQRLREALDVSRTHGLPRYECLQPGYNLYDRKDYEGPLEHLCLAEHVGVIPYYGLASGFLTGKYRSAADFGKSPRGGRMVDYLNAKGRKILAALDAVAAAHNVKPAAVALAWLIARPSITAPIASATSVEQLQDFSAAAGLKLLPAEIATLDAAGAG